MSLGPGKRSITREELYEMVWSRPMTHVASEFGISGNSLAKVCRKMDVPYPPRGHWAKYAAGKAPPATALPPPKESGIETTIITATAVSSSGESPITEAQTSRDAAVELIGTIDVPERLTRPHPIIAGWIDERKRRQQEARLQSDPWRRDLYKVGDFTEGDRRRHRILNALFRPWKGKAARSSRMIAASCCTRRTARASSFS